MPDSQTAEGLEVAYHKDDIINIRTDQGRQALAKAIEEEAVTLDEGAEGDPVVIKARVYDNTFNRNAWRIAPEAMSAFAATAVGKNVLLNHDDQQVVGEILKSAAVKSKGSFKYPDVIEQTLEVRAQTGKDRLAHGGTPEFSVRLIENENTEIACSICDESVMDLKSECVHWRGLDYDGETAYHVYSSGRSPETSIVIGGATETFPLAHADAQTADLFQIHQQRLARISRQVASDTKGSTMETSSDTTTSATRITTAVADAAVADAGLSATTFSVVGIDTTVDDRLAALEGQLASAVQDRDSLQARVERMEGEKIAGEVRATIRKARVEGKLDGDEDEMVTVALESPGPVTKFLKFIPKNDARSAGVQLSGTGAPPAEGPSLSWAQLAEASRQEAMTKAEADGGDYTDYYEPIWARRRLEKQEADSAR